ncbi:hypothetical protein K2F40_08745 [Clostridium sp. CM028]|nr:hypothetical protein [Clostridium sp. CM027]MBW9149047.1 hypothetical protein [Clostridium sp. CM028]UVE42650.1 hypothetical protein KTC92_06375 [Clostridium sp. CM027]WLC63332.1 hypothetical protein KTC94_05305 [Clostridium sp. CM028]
MGIFSKKNKNRSITLSLVDGIDGYSKETLVSLTIDNDKQCLTINARVFKNPPIHLMLEQITGVQRISKSNIIQKNKSTVGRAAVGGVLLGPLGAIVGGMSGIGDKHTTETKYYMVINYKSQSRDVKVLSFKMVGFSNWPSFIKELKSKINTQHMEDTTEVYL